MKALIVDDEPWARFEMERLLAPYSWLTIIGQAASASEAIDYLEQEDLDAIFLDVQMQDGDGFSVLPSLPTPAPKIIFTTAYSNFAVRAFEVNALDYLLKPIAPDRCGRQQPPELLLTPPLLVWRCCEWLAPIGGDPAYRLTNCKEDRPAGR
jgi:DNA-binding LytR/AlgR family response regulator